jgi:hypothetical protein
MNIGGGMRGICKIRILLLSISVSPRDSGRDDWLAKMNTWVNRLGQKLPAKQPIFTHKTYFVLEKMKYFLMYPRYIATPL